MTEIPEEAVEAACVAMNGGVTHAHHRERWEPEVRTILAAALPHLRVQETPALELAESARAIAARLRIDLESVDREDTRIALGNSARDVIRLAELIEAPHPRPVVDREALRDQISVIEVHHHDIEKHAESFNEGYDEAQRQGIGDESSRNWLTEKVWPLLKDHIDPENSHHVADQIADALLSEADLSDLPTEEETKALAEVASKLGEAIGRKAAGEEIAEAIENAGDALADDRGMPATGFYAAAKIARDLTSQPHEAPSEPLTAPTGHPDLPEGGEGL